jgi:hypothetical protein
LPIVPTHPFILHYSSLLFTAINGFAAHRYFLILNIRFNPRLKFLLAFFCSPLTAQRPPLTAHR